MWHCWLQGILCLITKATSSWYKRHWTLLEYTPSHLSHRNNHINHSVQTWGVKMYTDIGLDPCPIRPLTCVFARLSRVHGCVCVSLRYMCMSVCEGRPSFISCCDQVFYMIWYDDTDPIKGGVVWKMWWQGKRKTRLWSDIWEREGDNGERNEEKERNGAKEWLRVGKCEWGQQTGWNHRHKNEETEGIDMIKNK